MSAYGRLVRRLGHARLFAALGRRVGYRLDRRLYRASGGRLSTLGRSESELLLLTTVGRRTGCRRTVPVLFIRDGARFVISSENFGQARAAAWPLNLDADPSVWVEVGSEVIACSAERLSPAEADHYWQRLVELWPAHRTYRARSHARHTFVLTPRNPEGRSGEPARPSRS